MHCIRHNPNPNFFSSWTFVPFPLNAVLCLFEHVTCTAPHAERIRIHVHFLNEIDHWPNPSSVAKLMPHVNFINKNLSTLFFWLIRFKNNVVPCMWKCDPTPCCSKIEIKFRSYSITKIILWPWRYDYVRYHSSSFVP